MLICLLAFCLDIIISKSVDIKTTFVDIKIHTLSLWFVKNIEPQNMSINPFLFLFFCLFCFFFTFFQSQSHKNNFKKKKKQKKKKKKKNIFKLNAFHCMTECKYKQYNL